MEELIGIFLVAADELPLSAETHQVLTDEKWVDRLLVSVFHLSEEVLQVYDWPQTSLKVWGLILLSPQNGIRDFVVEELGHELVVMEQDLDDRVHIAIVLGVAEANLLVSFSD